MSRFRRAGLNVRFCTNETQTSIRALQLKLQSLGFCIAQDEIHAPAPACCKHITAKALRPFLLVHPDSLEDYSSLDTTDPNAVVVGDAAGHFTYENMNKAFRILTKSSTPHLVSLGMG